MAKTETVVQEVMAEAHRLSYLVQRILHEVYVKKTGSEIDNLIEASELAQTLVNDLESLNLPRFYVEHKKRGYLIQREQNRRHTNRERARLTRQQQKKAVEAIIRHYDDYPLIRQLLRNNVITLEEAERIEEALQKRYEIETTGMAGKAVMETEVAIPERRRGRPRKNPNK